jgi:hypothetical protein
VLSTVHSNAEITPPLYFAAAWVTTQLGHAPELVRLPSLIAGALTIPAVYALGLRTVGRRAALVATALTALSPFMTYYSAEARAYGVMMLFAVLSTLAMLLAVDTGRTRWWVAYAAASCAAVYSHYTSVFLLAAQLAWLVWAHPRARRPALLANVGAAVGFAPWITGFVADLRSPTSKILSALSPFTPHDVLVDLGHWSVGYPYTWVAHLSEIPGTPALVLLGVGVLAGAAGLALRRPPLSRRIVLVLLLLASVPAGEALASAVSDNVFGVRNLAASWPAFALALAALLSAAGRRAGVAAAVLGVAAFAVASAELLENRYHRPDYRAAAAYVERTARPGDAVIDATAALSPGPVSGLDAALTRRPPLLLRSAAPAERDHPFGFADPIVTLDAAVARARALHAAHRILVVTHVFPQRILGLEQRNAAIERRFPPGYRLLGVRRYPGIADVVVRTYAPSR